MLILASRIQWMEALASALICPLLLVDLQEYPLRQAWSCPCPSCPDKAALLLSTASTHQIQDSGVAVTAGFHPAV